MASQGGRRSTAAAAASLSSSMMARNLFPVIDISRQPLHDIMLEHIRAKPERVALVDGVSGRSYTYAELDVSVCRLASGLHRLGIQKSDVVVIFCPNSIEYIFSVFAIVANGAIAAFVNPVYTPYELGHALKVTKPSWILTVSSLSGTVVEAKKNAGSKIKGMIVLPGDYKHPAGPAALRSATLSTAAAAAATGGCPVVAFDVLLSDDGSWYPTDVDIDSSKDVAFVLFSSGTTGLPKGVMLSHYNVVAMMSIIGQAFADDVLHSADEQPVTSVFLPFYHSYGLIAITMLSLATNQKLIVLPRFEPELLLSCIEKYKVTVVPLVPPTIVFLAKYPNLSKYDLSSVRRYNSGAAPLSEDTEKEFRSVTGCREIRQGFGMTETTVACIYNAPKYPMKPGSVGVAMPNTEAKVIDVGTKASLGPKERGELCIRGPQVMMGYINDPVSTRATIDEDGWLHTGDISYYDDDGYFYIVDRIKELIKYKAFQVAPAELESLILSHPEVADVGVIGVPDADSGELPKAFVVRKPGFKVTAEEIKQFVAGKVSSFKHLRGGVEFIEKIPKSETGKILRRALKQMEETRRMSKL